MTTEAPPGQLQGGAELVPTGNDVPGSGNLGPGHTAWTLDTPTVRQLRLAPAQYHEGFWESGAEFLSALYTQYPV